MKKSFRFYYLGLILFGLFLVVPLLTSATPQPSLRLDSGVIRFFSETSNTAVDVSQYSANFYITNNCDSDLFVGNRTGAEWLSFKNNTPGCVGINFKNCGDLVCNSVLENYANCSDDCLPLCGDGVCLGETCSSCSADCGSCCGNGVCDNRVSLECYNSSLACLSSPNYYCSINISGGVPTGTYSHCSANCTSSYCESSTSCPGDCPACGDGFCNDSAGENNFNCPADCLPFCGDGMCNGSETSSSCILDCKILPVLPVCGDGFCASGESSLTCPADCPLMACNGNGICEDYLGETHSNCPDDCLTPFICGDGICACPMCQIDEICPQCETIDSCPQDCVAIPPAYCGDGICQAGEPDVCFQDCGFGEVPILQ